MPSVQILRSRRKTLAIEVHLDGRVLVRAPLRTSQRRIDALIKDKQAWIDQKLIQAQSIGRQNPVHLFSVGEQFPYLGAWYPLELVQRSLPTLELATSFRLSAAAVPSARQVFTEWYRKQAAKVFSERYDFWVQHTGLAPTHLSLSSARTRWGSCGPSGSINLTWRLVMAPLASIDYVIVHELSHLVIKNHSRFFWSEVEKHMPDYRQARDWLKKNGHRLDI